MSKNQQNGEDLGDRQEHTVGEKESLVPCDFSQECFTKQSG